MANSKLAEEILEGVGGKANVEMLTHCATRLRFTLKDASIVDGKKLDSLKGVMGVVPQGDSAYQIVIGGGVADVYAQINSLLDKGSEMSNDDVKAAERKKVKGKNKIADQFFEFLSDSFRPIIGVLVGASIILALINLMIAIPFIPLQNVTDYPVTIFLNAMAMAVFKFLPVIIAYNAFKKLNMDPMIGTICMLVLFTPQFLALGDPEANISLWKDTAGNLNNSGFQAALGSISEFSNEVLQKNLICTKIFGIDMLVYDYSSNVLLPLLIAGIGYWIDKGLKKIIPGSVQLVFIPVLEIIIFTSLAALVIGPIAVYAGSFLGELLAWLNYNAPFIFAILIPMLYPFLVPLGLHWPINAIILLNIGQTGYDFIQGPMGCWNFACFGATFGVLIVSLREKNKSMTSVAGGALAAGLIGGISEPSLYGIHLRYKKIYPKMLIGCAVGGITIGVLGFLFPSTIPGASGVTVNAFAYQSLLTIPLFNQTWVFAVSIAVSFIIPAVLIATMDYRTEEQKLADKQV